MNIFGNTVWHLVSDADLMCKGVLFTLLLLSIFCWTILVYKFVMISRKRKELKRALFLFKNAKKIDDVLTISAQLHYSYPGKLLSTSLKTVKDLLAPKKGMGAVALNTQDFELLKHTVDQKVETMVTEEESYFSLVSASAALSPLLGLFGTVWGLIDAFIRISQKQNADIATVAPGVAEALVTTAAGLMVAVPALAMVYYLNGQLRTLERQLYILADKFVLVAYQLFGASAQVAVDQDEPQTDMVDVLEVASPNTEEHEWHG